MPVDLFGQVDDIVRSISSHEALQSRFHRYGIKVWFGPEKPTREHYEAQLLSRHKVDGVKGLALEVGFHAENKDEAANDAAVATLRAKEKTWRKRLGSEATAGPFIGAEHWRRVSELWFDPELDDDDAAFEIASRLVDYMDAFQPILDG